MLQQQQDYFGDYADEPLIDDEDDEEFLDFLCLENAILKRRFIKNDDRVEELDKRLLQLELDCSDLAAEIEELKASILPGKLTCSTFDHSFRFTSLIVSFLGVFRSRRRITRALTDDQGCSIGFFEI
jgi:hypothetical protein